MSAPIAQTALRHLEIVMVGTKFPENVGMAVRACANMGCTHLTLAAPFRWNKEKALSLATPKGEPLLDTISIQPDMATALRHAVLTIGTTARTGGWRQGVITPEKAAEEAAPLLMTGNRVIIVFGPEDHGLTNEEITQCQRLVTIPTAGMASSLNVAQAILILVYECMKAVSRCTLRPSLLPEQRPPDRRITHQEQELLYTNIRETLLAIDYLKNNNPDYFLLPLRRFLDKSGLHRHELDMLMGICRQIQNLKKRSRV